MGEEMEPGIRRRIGRNPDLSQVQVGAETMQEMFARVDAEFRERRRIYDDGSIADIRWYGWRLNPAELTLTLVDSTDWPTYPLRLLRCDQPAQMLDWLIQVSGKSWPQYDMEKVTVGLLRALDDIFEPQSTMCSFGQNRTLTEQQIRDRVATFMQLFHEGEQP
jgi:hypothetical protein